MNIPSLCNEVYDENEHLYLSVKSQETKNVKSSDIRVAKLPNTLTIVSYNVQGLKTAMDSLYKIGLIETFITDVFPTSFFLIFKGILSIPVIVVVCE